MNLAQQIANPVSGASLLRLYDTPQPHHLRPANTALQKVRKVVEKALPEDDLPASADRQREILELAQARGRISYADAASALQINTNTARNTIRLMCQRNRLVRVEGSLPWVFELPGKAT